MKRLRLVFVLALFVVLPLAAQDAQPAAGCVGDELASLFAPVPEVQHAPEVAETGVGDPTAAAPLFTPEPEEKAYCCGLSDIQQCETYCGYRGCWYSVSCRGLSGCQCTCVC